MLFSDEFNINKTGNEDWFDPILDDDTLLFVDPFLISIDNSGSFQGTYEKVMSFFENVFEEAANIPYNITSPRFRVLVDRVVFPEPREACLGYSIGTVDGAGSGGGFAKVITRAIYDSINAGIHNINHFEELGIFNSNIKEDRISDITLNILKEEFIRYTQNICDELNIQVHLLPCRVFDWNSKRWFMRKFNLPKNPFNNGPIILIPKRFLATINALNSQDFLDYCWEQFDDNVKDQLNVAIKSNIDKNRIIEIARNNPDWVNSYVGFKESKNDNTAYDLDLDPAGVYGWHSATENYVKEISEIIHVQDQNGLIQFLDDIANHFQSYIEKNDGYLMILDEKSKPKRERASQYLLYGLIKNICKKVNCLIELKEAGKGLITFKFSNGFSPTAFLEVKYARNKELLKTFESFLDKTVNGDETIFGYYFVIGFRLNELNSANDLEEDLLQLANEHNFQLKYKVIDASI